MEKSKKQDLPEWMVTIFFIWYAISLVWRILPETEPAFCEAGWYKISMLILFFGFFIWLTVSPKYRFNYWWWLSAVTIATGLFFVAYMLWWQ